MFSKKFCKKCKSKISSQYNFCPNCGNSLVENLREDWGMLGKNDFINSKDEMRIPMNLSSIFNTLIKGLTEQMDNSGENEKSRGNPFNKKGFSISISTSNNRFPEINLNSSRKNNSNCNLVEKNPKNLSLNFSEESLNNFFNLPKEEPITNIRRFSDKILYEIDLPGVKSLKDISIIKLENSIEIKAISKDKAYSKIISINFPIIDYEFLKGKLVLGFGVK